MASVSPFRCNLFSTPKNNEDWKLRGFGVILSVCISGLIILLDSPIDPHHLIRLL